MSKINDWDNDFRQFDMHLHNAHLSKLLTFQ